MLLTKNVKGNRPEGAYKGIKAMSVTRRASRSRCRHLAVSRDGLFHAPLFALQYGHVSSDLRLNIEYVTELAMNNKNKWFSCGGGGVSEMETPRYHIFLSETRS